MKALAARHRLPLRTLHTHIGSGTDPDVSLRVTRMTLDLAAQLPDVTVVNLGSGFKVGRMPEEPTVDMDRVGSHVERELKAFRERHGRPLHLELEPGTYLVAQAGVVVATCIDVVDTGKDGFLFAKLDTGMTEVTRPSLSGAQHPIDVLATGCEAAEVVFVGPCCESGDILTPAPGDPEGLGPRWVPRPRVGDLVIVVGAGAYCARAIRMVAPHRAIETRSIEAYWERWGRCSDNPGAAPPLPGMRPRSRGAAGTCRYPRRPD